MEFLPSQAGLSPTPPPQDAEILGFVEWRGWGMMIFGFIPVGNVGAEDAQTGLLEAARRLGADGVASVRVCVTKTPPPLSFIWWYRSVGATGIAYRVGRSRK